MRTGTPPDSEGYIRAIFGHEPDRGSSPAAIHTRIAHREAGKAWASIFAKHKALKGDLSKSDAQRILADADQAQKALIRAQQAADTARESVRSEVEDLTRKMQAKLRPTDSATAVADAEVRTYLRSLKPAERSELARRAVASGDLDTARAVAGAQPFLSGVEPEMHSRITGDFLSVVATNEHQEAEAIAEGVRKMEHALSELRAHADHYVDFNAAARLIANQVTEE